MPLQGGVKNIIATSDRVSKASTWRLKNELVLAPLTYRDRTQDFVGVKEGDTITVKMPYRAKTTEGRVLGVEPMIDQTVVQKIDRHRNFGLSATVVDTTLTIDKFEERYLKSGVIQLANVVDRSIAEQLNGGIFTQGTAGAGLDTTLFLMASAHQTDIGIPDDGNRVAVLTPTDRAITADKLALTFNEGQTAEKALRKGRIGTLGGYTTYESANLTTHTVGDYSGTPLANSATAQTGNSIVTDGWGASKTILKKNDMISFAGVYEINPQSYESTGRLATFNVTADITSDASGNATITISPSINDGTLTMTDVEGNTVSSKAYQNVSDPIVDNAVITVYGDANGIYRQAFFFHKDAISFIPVPLKPMTRASESSAHTDGESGLSMSHTEFYDGTNHEETKRIDFIWGVKLIRPELVLRVYTAKIN